MGTVQRIYDGLRNVITGTGTSRDRREHAFYSLRTIDWQEVYASYRDSWMMRKVARLPALDMTRAGRDWQATKETIARIEEQEKRFELWTKLRRGITLGRLGGGAIIIGVGSSPDLPLAPDQSSAKLSYLHVVSRHRLSLGDIDQDVASPTFDQPLWFNLTTGLGQVRIHPSRVICFKGLPVDDDHAAMYEDRFWGDPVYRSVIDAIKDSEGANSNFATLTNEAKYDVLKFHGLVETLAQPGGEQRIRDRVDLATIGKSTHRAIVLGDEDEWDVREINWSGIPDVAKMFLSIVAAAADIPATRLLGKSPDGMNATGEGDETNYLEMISALQEEVLRPALDRIDAVMLASAGIGDPDAWWSFAPLKTMTEKERAEIAKSKADTITQYVNNGTVPIDALAQAVPNMLIEDGLIPGLEQAMNDVEAAAKLAPDPEEDDPSLLTEEEDEPPARRVAANDATPRTLYVRRDVLNWAEIARWAKDQGFTTTVGDKMHVTIAFSRQPVDWLKMGRDWESDKNGKMTVAAGGPRLVEPLGDGGAVVLLFSSTDLQWRHKAMVEAGASWDHDQYQPHVTISWDATGVNLDAVKPYTGPIELGPEIFEEVKENWQATITEDCKAGA